MPCHGVEWVVQGSAEEVGWSLFPREAGLFDRHHDEKTGPKWVCRGELIYPLCPIAVPAAHFGTGRQEQRRGRNGHRWQVEPSLIYGQVKKCYRRHKLVRVAQVMRLGTEAALQVALQHLGFSGSLNTAFIERVNLTVRHGVAALARRTWATSQQSPHLLAHLEGWRAYYHFVRPHQSLRVRLMQPRERGGNLLAQRYRHLTPAMAAGRTTRRWTAREVLLCPLLPIST